MRSSDLDDLIVFAKDDSCLVVCDILWTHVGMHWDVLFTVWKMCILVVAHFGGDASFDGRTAGNRIGKRRCEPGDGSCTKSTARKVEDRSTEGGALKICRMV